MKRLGTILLLSSILALCLQGCGDKEKGDAMAKWQAFQTEQIATIQAASDQGNLKPYDFEQKVLEVKDLPYKFKGLISYKMGNIFQEQSYAFVDGSWTPVNYVCPKDKKAEKERIQKVERIEKQIKELNKEIEKDEKDLNAYKQLLERLKAKKTNVATLQSELEKLKGSM